MFDAMEETTAWWNEISDQIAAVYQGEKGSREGAAVSESGAKQNGVRPETVVASF